MKVGAIFGAFASLSLLAFAMPASAASPSQLECEAAGGTFTKERGTVECVTVESENVGASENSQTTTTTTTTTGRGNSGNKPTSDTQCAGPGASTGSAHCKK